MKDADAYAARTFGECVDRLLDRITSAATEADALTIARGCTMRELHALCDLLYVDVDTSVRERLVSTVVREARA